MLSGPLQFDEAAHRYSVGGVVLPSVTQILRPISPDFSAIPPAVLERKRALGTAVHLACELYDQGELDEDGLSAELVPYLYAWIKFRAECGVEILANERRLYHPLLRFAGTLDRVTTHRSAKGAPTWLLDLKTSEDPAPAYGVQLFGYLLLLACNTDEAVKPEHLAGLRRGTVHLRDDGTYRLHEYKNPNDEAAFRALLSIAQWKEANQ